MSTAAD